MKRRDFTEDQVSFVMECIEQAIPQRRVAEMYTEHFSESIGQTELRRLMKRYGIESQRKPNKMLPVGTEKWNDYYQCVMVKVNEYSVSGEPDKKKRDYLRNAQWQMKQNLVWEKTTGRKLPWRHCVIFLDGDRTNYSPDNLYAVPLQVAGAIEKWKMHSEDVMIYKSALMYGELYFLMMKEAPEVMDRMKSM